MTDIPEVDGGAPVEFQSRYYGLFCVVFVFVGQLFMLQLFVSVIIGRTLTRTLTLTLSPNPNLNPNPNPR